MNRVNDVRKLVLPFEIWLVLLLSLNSFSTSFFLCPCVLFIIDAIMSGFAIRLCLQEHLQSYQLNCSETIHQMVLHILLSQNAGRQLEKED